MDHRGVVAFLATLADSDHHSLGLQCGPVICVFGIPLADRQLFVGAALQVPTLPCRR